MADIHVAKSFKLTLDNGRVVAFTKGQHMVDDDVADHWYVKAHLIGAKAAAPPPGSLSALRAAGEAAKKAEQAEMDEQAAFEAELAAEARAKSEADLAAKTKTAIMSGAVAAQKAANQIGAKTGK